MSTIKYRGQWKYLDITHYHNGILFANPMESAEMNIGDLEDYLDFLTSIIGNEKTLFLTDLSTHFIDMSTPVLNYLANSQESKNMRIADAIIVKYVPNRIMANFYINFFKPKEPTKIFNNLDTATVWLLDKKIQHEQSLMGKHSRN